jgi:Kef-type K+ transport system membrane component KefB
MPSIFFIIGAVVVYLLVSLIAGRLLPALSLPSILAVIIGGVIGEVIGFALAGSQAPKEQDKKADDNKPES